MGFRVLKVLVVNLGRWIGCWVCGLSADGFFGTRDAG